MSAQDPGERLSAVVAELRKDVEAIRETSSRFQAATGAWRTGYLTDLLAASQRLAGHAVKLACAVSVLLYEAQKESS